MEVDYLADERFISNGNRSRFLHGCQIKMCWWLITIEACILNTYKKLFTLVICQTHLSEVCVVCLHFSAALQGQIIMSWPECDWFIQDFTITITRRVYAYIFGPTNFCWHNRIRWPIVAALITFNHYFVFNAHATQNMFLISLLLSGHVKSNKTKARVTSLARDTRRRRQQVYSIGLSKSLESAVPQHTKINENAVILFTLWQFPPVDG